MIPSPPQAEKQEASPVISNIWTSKDLSDYLNYNSKELLPGESMPQTIGLMDSEQEYLDKHNTHIQGILDVGNTRDLYRSTFYSYSPNDKISKYLAMDILYYRCENQAPSSTAIYDFMPPEPNFLAPLLDGARWDNSQTHGQLFISNNMSLLILRTSDTYKIYGNETPPRYAHKARFPAYFKPNIYTKTRESMENFLNICTIADLAVYFRAKYPAQREYGQYHRVNTYRN